MSFIKSSCTFTRFRITDPVPAALWSTIGDKLKQFAFKDIDDIPEERSWGWVSFEDMLDITWREATPEKGAYIAFSLRLDTRRIPPAVLRKHHALALREEDIRNREQGKKYVSRERKKELKEQVKIKLMLRTLPIPAEFNVVWNIQENMVYIASAQTKLLELFQTEFTRTFDLHLEQLTPYGLASSILGEENLSKLDHLESTTFA